MGTQSISDTITGEQQALACTVIAWRVILDLSGPEPSHCHRINRRLHFGVAAPAPLENWAPVDRMRCVEPGRLVQIGTARARVLAETARQKRSDAAMRITGTFLDEITHDIPSQNWGAAEWAADFEVMRKIGIDTVIIIRSGYREQAIFNSWTLRKHRPMLPVRENLAALFLDLAQHNDMRLLWGIYDPKDWAQNGTQALEVNKEFMTEVRQQFSQHPAFGGWYLTFELSRNDPRQVDLVVAAGRCAKELTPDLPTMISPYIAGTKAPDGIESISRTQHEEEWGAIFHQIHECVDIVAFQDGHVDFLEAPDYLTFHARLAREAGIACWSNVESFDRDTLIKFPPLDFRKLEYKMDVAREAGVDKLITFEFSHFMSPHSIYPAARNLFKRYCERFGIDVGPTKRSD